MSDDLCRLSVILKQSSPASDHPVVQISSKSRFPNLFWLFDFEYFGIKSNYNDGIIDCFEFEKYRTQESEAAWTIFGPWSFPVNPSGMMNNGVRRETSTDGIAFCNPFSMVEFKDKLIWNLHDNVWSAPFWCRWSDFCNKYQWVLFFGHNSFSALFSRISENVVDFLGFISWLAIVIVKYVILFVKLWVFNRGFFVFLLSVFLFLGLWHLMYVLLLSFWFILCYIWCHFSYYVEISGVSDNEIYHYQLNLKERDSARRLTMLPSNSKNGVKFRHESDLNFFVLKFF